MTTTRLAAFYECAITLERRASSAEVFLVASSPDAPGHGRCGASFRADKTPNVVGDAAGQACALCHRDAGPARDWVYRANIHFAGGSGAIPQPAPGQVPEQPFVDNYTFVPATITVPVGTIVTWTNRDQVKHTVTATNASFSGFLPQGGGSGGRSTPLARSSTSVRFTRV